MGPDLHTHSCSRLSGEGHPDEPVEVGNGELHAAAAGRVDDALGHQPISEHRHLRSRLAGSGCDIPRLVRPGAERRQRLDIGDLRSQDAYNPGGEERRVESVLNVRPDPLPVGRRDRVADGGFPCVIRPRLGEEGEAARSWESATPRYSDHRNAFAVQVSPGLQYTTHREALLMHADDLGS